MSLSSYHLSINILSTFAKSGRLSMRDSNEFHHVWYSAGDFPVNLGKSIFGNLAKWAEDGARRERHQRKPPSQKKMKYVMADSPPNEKSG